MIHTLYIEEAVQDHPRTAEICAKFPQATQIPCRRYTEVFNRKGQNFRLQKRGPALILGHKFDTHVLEAPPGYGIGGQRNYYFSHMLNCIYDCRYCFLQGMYSSANYLLFVNYEDFHQAIPQVAIGHRLSIALTKLEAEFGMTPSSRSRIYVPIVRKTSKLDAFLRSHALSRGAQSGQS